MKPRCSGVSGVKHLKVNRTANKPKPIRLPNGKPNFLHYKQNGDVENTTLLPVAKQESTIRKEKKWKEQTDTDYPY